MSSILALGERLARYSLVLGSIGILALGAATVCLKLHLLMLYVKEKSPMPVSSSLIGFSQMVGRVSQQFAGFVSSPLFCDLVERFRTRVFCLLFSYGRDKDSRNVVLRELNKKKLTPVKDGTSKICASQFLS